MSAEKFFNEHSIEEISKKTKISPISLRFIKNREYDKIPRVKFIGFIKLIEREFKVDLSDLIEEYDAANGTFKKKPEKTEQISQTPKEPKKEKSFLLYILIITVLIITGIILYTYTNKPENIQQIEQNNTEEFQPQTEPQNNQTISQKEETNISAVQPKIQPAVQPNINSEKNETVQKTVTQENVKNTNIQPKAAVKEITIIPHEKVWYRAVNLDTNKTYEYLTSKVHTLPGGDYYIKFGHGNITIQYGDENITPNTKKIVRILLQNGKYKYLKKGIK